MGGVYGPTVDPAPPFELLDKTKIAKLRIRQIELEITQVEKYLNLLKLEQDLLMEEYDIK